MRRRWAMGAGVAMAIAGCSAQKATTAATRPATATTPAPTTTPVNRPPTTTTSSTTGTGRTGSSLAAWVSTAGGNHALEVSTGAGAHVRTLFGKDQDGVDDLMFSPDGTRLAFDVDTHANQQIDVLDLTTETVTRVYTTQESNVFFGFTWDRDGRSLVFSLNTDFSHADVSTSLWRVPAVGGQAVRLAGSRDRFYPSVGPSGNIYFAEGFSPGIMNSLWRADPDGAHAKRLFRMSGLSGPVISPNGKEIVFVHPGKSSANLRIISSAGKDVRDLTPHLRGRYDNSPSWSPNGTHLAFIRGSGTSLTSGSDVYEISASGRGAKPVIAPTAGLALTVNWGR